MSLAASLTVVKPTPITDAMLVTSTLAEDSAAEWSVTATYALGDRVSLAAEHKVYESLEAANIGKDPTSQDAWWVEVGPTNRWAMFDGALGSTSVAPDAATPIIVTVRPGAISSVALLGVTAASVRIVMRNLGLVVYDQTFSLSTYTVTDWYEYFTAPFEYRTELVVTGLPLYSSAEVEVTITSNSVDPVAVGALLFGTTYALGTPLHGARLGIADYSRKETDEWGTTTLVERSYAREMDIDFVLDASALTRVYAVLSAIRATACVWMPSTESLYDALVIYGWAADFSINLKNRTMHYCSLSIRGLT